VVIGATQNWAKTVIEWNLASDSNFGPHTDGGCTVCLGAITIDKGVKKNVSYYVIAHASKYVKPGSFRIKSSENVAFPHVAFLTPEGTMVLIILNEANEPASISLKIGTKFISTTLASRSVSTIAVPL
jgi:glucosylceramidase